MASPAINLDRPPAQPPSVTSQMGGSMDAASMVGGGPAPAGASPKGQLVALGDAVKKLLENMAKIDDGFAPFAARATAQVDAGVQSSQSASPPNAGPGPTAPTPASIGGFPG